MNSRRILAPLVLCVTLFGCGKKDAAPARGPATAADLAKADSVADGTNTLAVIDATMQADSILSAAMVNRARRPDVRKFAITTMKRSHDLRVQTAEVAKRLDITPSLPPNDPTANDVSVNMSLINGGSKSTNMDGLFLSGVVSRNLALASLAALKSHVTKNPGLVEFFTQVAADCQKHVAIVAAMEKKK